MLLILSQSTNEVVAIFVKECSKKYNNDNAQLCISKTGHYNRIDSIYRSLIHGPDGDKIFWSFTQHLQLLLSGLLAPLPSLKNRWLARLFRTGFTPFVCQSDVHLAVIHSTDSLIKIAEKRLNSTFSPSIQILESPPDQTKAFRHLHPLLLYRHQQKLLQ